ncbi:pyridoxal-phosphate dependent enzyme [Frigidibacter sp. SD6-1]|uniref:pyridoxal-phosphate dependent enzyme n=1 Tax=Frigidibacter sp. SD6-1 TaxID=3032581 RepID=UPI0024E01D6B|nr:pyridoxal-phosphate dependent enzyme [Frigidibacter sp. SD6-1]
MSPTAADIARAYALTRQTTIRTPLIEVAAFAEASGAARVFVKAESLQKAGSFKIRGATWRLAQLTEVERKQGVIAFSSGNFAQGLAAAGKAAGVPVTIVMPGDAPEVKRRATEGYGARVVLSHHGDRPREEVASALARHLAGEQGLTLLHPFDDPAVVAGQAGVAVEALEQMAELGQAPDLVAAPTGGGGLIAGMALATRAALPGAEIWAVEPEGFDGMGRSLTAAAIGRVAPGAQSLCDALQATAPGAAPFAAAQAAGVRGCAVGDTAVRRAMIAAFEQLKLVLEPSGAAAIAALLSGQLPVKGRTVLLVASGGNIAFETFVALTRAAPEDGRTQ